MSEMVANAARIADAISLPLIADADTGYGNELNVYRTVRDYEAPASPPSISRTRSSRSAAAISTTRSSSRREDYVAKIRAAAARQARPRLHHHRPHRFARVLGFDEAIRRANAALEAGADVVFVEAPQTMEEVERCRSWSRARAC